MDIHRWRFVGERNPELMELIKMRQTFRGRYVVRRVALDRLRNALEG
jgi:hypothetical protein